MLPCINARFRSVEETSTAGLPPANFDIRNEYTEEALRYASLQVQKKNDADIAAQRQPVGMRK